jgi:hypothetical protein
MERIDEIRIFVVFKLKENIHDINYDVMNSTIYDIIRITCDKFNVYSSFDIINGILIVLFKQFSPSKYHDTLKIDLKPLLRTKKLLSITNE